MLEQDLVRGVYNNGHDAISVHASSPDSEIRSQHLPLCLRPPLGGEMIKVALSEASSRLITTLSVIWHYPNTVLRQE